MAGRKSGFSHGVPPAGAHGTVIIILMLAVFIMTIGLMAAFPLWRTVLQRDLEEELIFRGGQYVEAVRLYVIKYPGRLPSSLDELLEKKCIRKLYRDPMAKTGEWDVILNPGSGTVAPAVGSNQQVLVASEKTLSSIKAPRILGVVSSSPNRSLMIYNDQESYDKWLFFYGQEPGGELPKITRWEDVKHNP